jgi:hypothetical protein
MGREFESNRNFVWSEGDEVTAEVIGKYIKYHLGGQLHFDL